MSLCRHSDADLQMIELDLCTGRGREGCWAVIGWPAISWTNERPGRLPGPTQSRVESRKVKTRHSAAGGRGDNTDTTPNTAASSSTGTGAQLQVSQNTVREDGDHRGRAAEDLRVGAGHEALLQAAQGAAVEKEEGGDRGGGVAVAGGGAAPAGPRPGGQSRGRAQVPQPGPGGLHPPVAGHAARGHGEDGDLPRPPPPPSPPPAAAHRHILVTA